MSLSFLPSAPSLALFFDHIVGCFGESVNERWGCPPKPLLIPCSPRFSRHFPPAVAKVYIVSFRTHDDRIVLADNMRAAIKTAWEHGGADFQSRFDKSTAQAEQMKEGALRVL
jgi:hypothetical protein